MLPKISLHCPHVLRLRRFGASVALEALRTGRFEDSAARVLSAPLRPGCAVHTLEARLRSRPLGIQGNVVQPKRWASYWQTANTERPALKAGSGKAFTAARFDKAFGQIKMRLLNA